MPVPIGNILRIPGKDSCNRSIAIADHKLFALPDKSKMLTQVCLQAADIDALHITIMVPI
jgi:hypothetical protein